MAGCVESFGKLVFLEIHSADIDYVRATSVCDILFYRAERDVFRTSYIDGLDRPSGVNLWQFLQYRGFAKGRFAAGISDQGAIAQESGAPEHWDLFVSTPQARCSRVDVQATLLCPDPDALIREVGAYWAERAGGGELRARPRMIEGYGQGNTVYLGSRTSERMVRIYNKEKESEGRYPASLRVEVEFKSGQARSAYATLAAATDRAVAAYSLVAGCLDAAHICMPPVSQALLLPVSAGCKDTSAARTLRWLERSVKPAISRLRREGVSSETISGALYEEHW